jgi:hypothetical protein
MPLYKLMAERFLLSEDLEEANGELTEELDLIWQQNDLAIKDKLDAYGQLFDELNAEKKKLSFLKEGGVDRIRVAMHRIESLEIKLKRRLNMLSSGSKLKGNLYSFNPFLSRQRTLKYPELLKSDEAYLTIEIREDYWNALLDGDVLPSMPPFNIKKRTAMITELPDDHPAVETVFTPSVRIT